jgi:hypothetical protein
LVSNERLNFPLFISKGYKRNKSNEGWLKLFMLGPQFIYLFFEWQR